MITILVDTEDEYKEMKKFAIKYMCSQIPFNECGEYSPGHCYKCYMVNHEKYGIRVIPVDNHNSEHL